MTALNTDTTFAEITTGTSYEISEVTAADPAVITFAGGAEKVTNGDCEAAVPTMDGVSLTKSGCTVAQSAVEAHGGSDSALMTGNAVRDTMYSYFNDNAAAGLVSGTYYRCSVWVKFASGQGITEIGLRWRNNAGSNRELDTTTTTDSWVQLSGVFKDDGGQRVMLLWVDAVDVDGVLVYWDDFTVKPLHAFSVNDNITLSGVSQAESLSAEIATGSVDNLKYYVITATEVNHFYTGCSVSDIFLGSEAVISQALDANNKVKQFVEVNGKTSRISAILADGVVTAERDFSDLAAAITSAYGASASFTNYTAGDGWLPGNIIGPEINNNTILTIGNRYFVVQNDTPDFFYVGCKIGDFFESDGMETPDATNTVVEVLTTSALNDGSQTGVTTLLSDTFQIVNNQYFDFNTTIDAIDAGSVTPIAGTGYGTTITTTVVEDLQTIKGITTGGYAGLEASTAAEGVEVTELIIELGRGPGSAMISPIVTSIVRSIIRPIIR